MAPGRVANPRGTAVHNFNYENAKLAFNQEVGYILIAKKLQTRILPQKKDIEKIINDIKLKNTNYKQYFTEECQVVNENGKDILCQVNMNSSTSKPFCVLNIKQILSLDDLFDVMFELHMHKPYLDQSGILDHFTNCRIFNPILRLFWKSCETCNACLNKVALIFRPVAEITVFSLATSSGTLGDVFMYIEKNTNFVLLRPLTTALAYKANQIAYELLTIFADFGSPSYLDSNVLKEFFKEDVLNVLRSLDSPIKIPFMYYHSRNHKINIMSNKATNMIGEWMMKTGSTNWAIGAHVVQWLLNSNKVVDTYIRSKIVSGPIHSPYHALFGILPHTDIMNIKEKRQSVTTPKEKVLVDCSQCNHPIYKVYKCNFCQRLCHFSCCVRYVEQSMLKRILINKCVSCANNTSSVDEEIILGT